jgi:hypothetical protein
MVNHSFFGFLPDFVLSSTGAANAGTSLDGPDDDDDNKD